MHELMVAVRRLRRTPGMALVAVATLASGMSLALIAFGVLASAFLRPPPGVARNRDVMRVLVAQETATAAPWRSAMVVSLDQFAVLEQALDGVLDLAAYTPADVQLETGRIVQAHVVTARYFELLGAVPMSGTLLGPHDGDDARSGIIASRRLLRDSQGERSSATALSLNGVRVPIAGVADPAFGGLEPPRADIWIFSSAAIGIPGVSHVGSNGSTVRFSVIGERRPGISDARLRDALVGAADALQRNDSRPGITFRIAHASLLSPRGGHSRPLAEQLPAILLALSGVVLAIAIANLGGLQLSQAIERRRELAVRSALGAGRGHLLRLQLAESGVVSLGAAAVSIAGVWALHPVMSRLAPSLHASAIEWRLMLLAIGVTVVSAGAVAIMPALYTMRQGRRPELQESAYSSSSGRWYRGVLGIQSALTIVLLVVAATLLASVHAVRSEPLGFDHDGLLVGTLVLLEPGGPDAQRTANAGDPFAMRRDALLALRDSVGRLPGVVRASIATGAPAKRLGALVVSARTGPSEPGGIRSIGAILNAVDEEFFATTGLRVRQGRGFTAPDFAYMFAAAVISAGLARDLFGDANSVGECVTLNSPGGSTSAARNCTVVVGVVDDAKYLSITEPATPTLYLPLSPNTPLPAAALYVRQHASGGPGAAPILRLMRESDARTMVTTLQTLRSIVEPQTARYRIAATAAILLSIAGLIILATGLTAQLRIVFAARRKEIGVRLALGARPRHIGRFVGRDLLLGVAAGAGVGVVLANGAVRYVRPLLHGVSELTLWAYAVGLATVAVVAVIAVGLPAFRATRTPPLEALR